MNHGYGDIYLDPREDQGFPFEDMEYLPTYKGYFMCIAGYVKSFKATGNPEYLMDAIKALSWWPLMNGWPPASVYPYIEGDIAEAGTPAGFRGFCLREALRLACRKDIGGSKGVADLFNMLGLTLTYEEGKRVVTYDDAYPSRMELLQHLGKLTGKPVIYNSGAWTGRYENEYSLRTAKIILG